ncbi:uncharacterized protein BO88DRAFT_114764 [Aspergillus vadensis CBS 113365]|uniref:Uncharacterized protein n=1 Tax=Aspergillus vadensis (strain CBS 113365 / IMI 142717 / IBT 24658) TaxID=1448311 RepID=A0A319B396_ASPVC|nr:hypothetical protein BO88DRAFT_114764 [Aspergillus vadensis CBS 113365]PYH66281.1 hypothetical protein BO88DRAFT_114764 [Aspergillus vadensis CBS 113365]
MEPYAGLVASCCFPPFPFAYVYYPGRRPVAYSLGLGFSAHLLTPAPEGLPCLLFLNSSGGITCSHLSTRAFGDLLWGCKFSSPLQRLMVVNYRRT